MKLFFKYLIFLAIYKTSSVRSYGLESITAKNYEEKVLGNAKEAYILAVKDIGKRSLEDWMEVEYNLRGLFVKVGIIDPRKDGAFLKRKVGQLH